MAKISEQIAASLEDRTREAIIAYRIGDDFNLKHASEEERMGVVLVHALEALRFCRRATSDSVDVDAEMVARRLNEDPFFFFNTQNLIARRSHADDLLQFGCFPCSPVAG